MKKLCSVLLVGLYVFFSLVPLLGFAQKKADPFILIPKAEKDYGEGVKTLGKSDNSGAEKFWNIYNGYAKDYKDDLGAQMGSGIMNWDTILSLLNQVVIFIANAALVVGAAMVIYAGYLYASHIFSGADASSANNAIKYAIMGIVVVIFSYTILRVVIHAFL